jgi:F-type H+-transporting ATPase subunit gamma
MPALIDLRRRIKSVRNTQQITQAMKTVATAKFKKAQRSVLEGRPYWHHSPELLAALREAEAAGGHPLMAKRPEKRIRMLVITSDKGLAGAFNANLLEQTHTVLKEKQAEGCGIRLSLLGKKAVLFFNRLDFPVDLKLTGQVQNISESEIRKLAQDLMRGFVLNRTDAVYVAYNEFKSILAPEVKVIRLLPLEPPEDAPPLSGSPDWEPGISSYLHTLLPGFVEDQVCHYVFESLAAEHAARMMAMDNATNNAGELIDDLTLVLNKIRQASITKELLEIMSAVEALSKNR